MNWFGVVVFAVAIATVPTVLVVLCFVERRDR